MFNVLIHESRAQSEVADFQFQLYANKYGEVEGRIISYHKSGDLYCIVSDKDILPSSFEQFIVDAAANLSNFDMVRCYFSEMVPYDGVWYYRRKASYDPNTKALRIVFSDASKNRSMTIDLCEEETKVVLERPVTTTHRAEGDPALLYQR